MSSVHIFTRNQFHVEWQKGDDHNPMGLHVLIGPDNYRKWYAGYAEGKAAAIRACKRKGGKEVKPVKTATLWQITTQGAFETKPRKIAVTRSVRAVLTGVYSEAESDIVTPDYAAIREALPHYWRAAWDRRVSFWYLKDAKLYANGAVYPPHGNHAYTDLRNTRGKVIATIRAEAFLFSPNATPVRI